MSLLAPCSVQVWWLPLHSGISGCDSGSSSVDRPISLVAQQASSADMVEQRRSMVERRWMSSESQACRGGGGGGGSWKTYTGLVAQVGDPSGGMDDKSCSAVLVHQAVRCCIEQRRGGLVPVPPPLPLSPIRVSASATRSRGSDGIRLEFCISSSTRTEESDLKRVTSQATRCEWVHMSAGRARTRATRVGAQE